MDRGIDARTGDPATAGAAGPAAAGASVVRVVVVDDQAPFRTAARAVVDRTDGFEVVGEADDGAAALAVVASVDPDLVLMDVKMPVMDGIEATTRLSEVDPDLVVFLVSSHDRSSLPEDLEASGAAAYLPKEDLSPTVLTDLWQRHVRSRSA